jgi:hypothetical protein
MSLDVILLKSNGVCIRQAGRPTEWTLLKWTEQFLLLLCAIVIHYIQINEDELFDDCFRYDTGISTENT